MVYKTYLIKDNKNKLLKEIEGINDYRYWDFYDEFTVKYALKKIFKGNYEEISSFDFEGIFLKINGAKNPFVLLVGPNKDTLDNTIMKIEHDFDGKFKFEEER